MPSKLVQFGMEPCVKHFARVSHSCPIQVVEIKFPKD